MKKLSLTIVLCLTVALVFGQKKALSEAKREIGNAKPNIDNAKNLIKGALEDPETKDDAEAWFIAGKIEGRQFDDETVKTLQSKTPDEAIMYGALKSIKPYFEIADSLDMLPDIKGKVKPKYRKDMKAILLANRLQYLNGGGYYFNNREYPEAYDMFYQFFDIPKMNMFKGDNIAVNDTAYAQFRYYAGLSLSQFEADTAKIITFFESIKDNNGYNEDDIYKSICALYDQVKDTVNFVKILKEGVRKFPEDSYYLLNLIQQYIYSNNGDAAIEMLTKAIVSMPDRADLYNVLGFIYENSEKVRNIEAAKSNYEKALVIDPEYVEATGNMGRIFFNQAVEAYTAANDIADNEKYRVAKADAIRTFKEALPYYEKAHQMNPDERDYMFALNRIYYILKEDDKSFEDKFNEMEKKLEKFRELENQ